jgi:hypothetical protein
MQRRFGLGLSRGTGSGVPPTPAVLSDLAYADDLISVTTDTSTGTIYYLLHNSVTPLSGSAIKAAVVGLTAVGGGTLDPVDTGNQPVDWTGVTPGNYWINMVQDNGAFSNVVLLAATITADIFDPASISAFVWDAADLTTQFQDTAAATPVTTTGQPIGRHNNRGFLGGYFQNTGATDRPTYNESGALRYWAFDGANDYLRFVGSAGSVDISGGFYMVIGVSQQGAGSFKGYASGAATGSSLNTTWGFQLLSGNGSAHSVGFEGGASGAAGTDIYDTTAEVQPLSVVEIEVTPATGSTNAWLRVRRVADGDVVEKGTAAASAGGFPDTATITQALSLGSRLVSGSPGEFANIRMYCGALVSGAVTEQQKDDMRAWVAGKIGF